MIARLSGTIEEKSAGQVVVNVAGVGYGVYIPYSTYYDLGDVGDRVSLRIYTHVKENDLSLYGFLTEREKNLFHLLIQISGIGPKLGVTILSGLPVDDLVAAVHQGDLARLNSIPGVGKKTAERIILELKEKLDGLLPEEWKGRERGQPGVSGDVVSALVNLGYAKIAAEKAVRDVPRDQSEAGFEALLKGALNQLSRS